MEVKNLSAWQSQLLNKFNDYLSQHLDEINTLNQCESILTKLKDDKREDRLDSSSFFYAVSFEFVKKFFDKFDQLKQIEKLQTKIDEVNLFLSKGRSTDSTDKIIMDRWHSLLLGRQYFEKWIAKYKDTSVIRNDDIDTYDIKLQSFKQWILINQSWDHITKLQTL